MFVLETYTKKNSAIVSEALASWVSTSTKKTLATQASNIAKKAIESLQEKHAFIWAAKKDDKICAVLIADETVDHKKTKQIYLRYLTKNVDDITSRGCGIFLLNTIQQMAKKQNISIVLVSDNADKFWKKQDFKINPSDTTQYIWTP